MKDIILGACAKLTIVMCAFAPAILVVAHLPWQQNVINGVATIVFATYWLKHQ